MSSGLGLMSVTDYAKHRACSDSYVRRMRRQGRLVLLGEQIDVAASDALLDATTDPLRGGIRDPGQGPNVAGDKAAPGSEATPRAGSALRDAMTRERDAKARLAELDLGERSKQLVQRRDVTRDVFTLTRQALQRLRTMGSRLRGALAAESDARKCEALIDLEVRQIAADMQKAAQALLGGGDAFPTVPPASVEGTVDA